MKLCIALILCGLAMAHQAAAQAHDVGVVAADGRELVATAAVYQPDPVEPIVVVTPLPADAGPLVTVPPGVTTEPTPTEAASGIAAAARAGDWLLVAGGVLWLLVHLLRWRQLTERVPWFKTRIGGYALNAAAAALVVIAGALWAGDVTWWELVPAAIVAALAASGLHEAAKDVTAPARA